MLNKQKIKVHTFISPEGEAVSSTEGISAFARKYGLDKSTVSELTRGKVKKHKGWTLKTVDTNQNPTSLLA